MNCMDCTDPIARNLKRCHPCHMGRGFVDDVVVERLRAGYPVPNATRSEKRAAAESLIYSRSAPTLCEIARRVGVGQATVSRWLDQLPVSA